MPCAIGEVFLDREIVELIKDLIREVEEEDQSN